jgi:hypothetical protein
LRREEKDTSGVGVVEKPGFVPQKVLPVPPILSSKAQNASGKIQFKTPLFSREKHSVNFSRLEKPLKTSKLAVEIIPKTLFSRLISTYFPRGNRRFGMKYTPTSLKDARTM